MRAEAIVVGAGIAGASAAYHLTSRGISVRLLDGSDRASGATSVAPGLLTAMSDEHSASPFDRLKRDMQAGYEAALPPSAKERGAVPTWTGSLRVRRFDEERAPGQVVSAGEARVLEPTLNPGPGGWWTEGDGHVDPIAITDAFLAASSTTGRLRIEPHRVTGLVVDGDRCTGAQTEHGRVTADVTVCAPGADPGGLLASVGIPITPVRGQLLRHRGDPRLRIVILIGDSYAVSRGDLTLVGATEEDVGFDTHPNPCRVRDLDLATRSLFGTVPTQSLRTGFRPALPDRLPAVGEHPRIRDLFMIAGLFRNGILLGPSAGEAISLMIAGGGVPDRWAPFAPARLGVPA